jgi:acetyl-CoA/propionyl-CoA carboxylase biotin carboxyl carrier protein
MNTRLQVEHPVTELVTGVDLVELQLRVAAGEPLPFTQADVEIEGHAIECRINAEDPAAGAFLPSPGRITKMHAASGFGTRWDGGYEGGDEISQYYDNLVGKLCVWGRDRDVAVARMIRALEETEIEGIATVIPADLAILRHPDFRAVEHSTKWVESVLDLSEVRAAHAPTEAAQDEEPKVRRDLDVEVNGKRFSVSMFVPESQLTAAPGGARPRPKRRRGEGAGAGAGVAGSGKVAVPMQGTIVKVEAEVGQSVAAGDTLVVLEAMKMENNVASDVDGTVVEVKVEPGQSVSAGEVVVVIEPAG